MQQCLDPGECLLDQVEVRRVGQVGKNYPTQFEGGSPLKAAILEAPKRLVIKDVDEPLCGEHEVLIEVRASGICGSDLHAYRGHHPFRRPPVILGHEVAGEVIQVGSAVEKLKLGDRVAIEPHLYCGSCSNCVRGLPNLCDNKRVPGVGWAGTFSERIVAPESICHRLAESVTHPEGAMLEPLAVAYRAFRIGKISMGYKVAILGAGTIGSLIAHLCQKAGVTQLMVTDIKDYNLNFIASLGACQSVNAAVRDTVEEGRILTGREGFDAVMVTSGSKQSLIEATQLCRAHGRVVVVALYPGDIPFAVNRLVLREVMVQGSLTYTSSDFREVTDLVNSGTIDVHPFITQRVSIDEVPDIFARIDGGLDYIKIMIELGQEETTATEKSNR